MSKSPLIELVCGHKVPQEEDYGGEALCPWCKCERTTKQAEAEFKAEMGLTVTVEVTNADIPGHTVKVNRIEVPKPEPRTVQITRVTKEEPNE